MRVGLHNPYGDGTGEWLRGSFHGHSSENSGCATVPLEEGIRRYREIGTEFLAVTDHDRVTDLDEVRQACREMILLQGFEYSSRENLTFAGEEVPPLYELPLEEALERADGLLTFVCHPRPYSSGADYWTVEAVEALGRMPDGIEVYNGHYGTEEALAGGRQPLYADFWDELLARGHRIWGFANDDFHDPEDLGNAFNMVLVRERTASALVAAARQGRSYGSTGLLLSRVELEGEKVRVEVDSPCTGQFVGPGGEILAQGEGVHFEYLSTGEDYIRFQAEGEEGLLFLQPFFRIA